MTSFEEILRFWFPGDELVDAERATARLEWWFRGGADPEILSRFVPVLERAAEGELDRVAITRRIADEAPAELPRVFEFSANQACGHRDVISRFGRHPQRNAALGRISTPEEEAYLASGDVVPLRSRRDALRR